MAKFEISGLEELMQELSGMADRVEDAAPAIINRAAPFVVKLLSSNIRQAANRGYATGELAGSIQASRAARNQYGCYCVVRPTGTDQKGVRNIEKLVYLEYGVAAKGQAAHPLMDRTRSQAEDTVVDTMQQAFEKEVLR